MESDSYLGLASTVSDLGTMESDSHLGLVSIVSDSDVGKWSEIARDQRENVTGPIVVYSSRRRDRPFSKPNVFSQRSRVRTTRTGRAVFPALALRRDQSPRYVSNHSQNTDRIIRVRDLPRLDTSDTPVSTTTLSNIPHENSFHRYLPLERGSVPLSYLGLGRSCLRNSSISVVSGIRFGRIVSFKRTRAQAYVGFPNHAPVSSPNDTSLRPLSRETARLATAPSSPSRAEATTA